MTKSKFKTEFYWFLIAITISILLFVSFYGIESIKGEIDLDLNFHDTYFVIKSFSLYFYLLSLLLFLVYLSRMAINRLNNLATNIAFLISAVFFSTQLTSVIILVDKMTVFSGFTIYPPLSSLGPDSVKGNSFETLFYVLSALQFLVIASIVFITIRTGIKIQIQNKT